MLLQLSFLLLEGVRHLGVDVTEEVANGGFAKFIGSFKGITDSISGFISILLCDVFSNQSLLLHVLLQPINGTLEFLEHLLPLLHLLITSICL